MHPIIDNYLITLDKLELMLEHNSFFSAFGTELTTLIRANAKPNYSSNNTVLEKLTDTQNTNTNYHLSFDILLSGEFIGKLLTDRTKFYQSDKPLVKISVDNKLLYSDNWQIKLQQVLADLNLKVHNFTYLELAIDTNTNARDNFYYYFNNVTDYYFKDSNKLKSTVTTISEEYRNGDENKSIYIGKADKRLIIYNKSEEIKKRGKQYINTYFQDNGLDISKDIYRIELKLKNTALKRYTTFYESLSEPGVRISVFAYEKLSNKCKPNFTKITVKKEIELTINDLTNTNYLLCLYKELFIIQFKLKDNNNVSRCTSIPFIDFSKIQTTIIKNMNMNLTPSRDANKLKELIKLNIKQYSITNVLAFYDAAVSTAKTYKLEDYLDKILAEITINKVVRESVSLF